MPPQVSISRETHAALDTERVTLQNGVTRTADGRYLACGHSFATVREASDFHRRMNRPLRSTLKEASASSSPQRPTQQQEPPGLATVQNARRTPPEHAAREQDGVTMTGDGRFQAKGYSFTTERQARDYLERRQRRADVSVPPLPRLQPAKAVQEARPAYRPGAGDNIRSGQAGASRPLKRQPVRWVAGPSIETVGGISFEACLVYVGDSDSEAYPRNRSLIDPALSIGHYDDPNGSTLSWNPDYRCMTPEARRSYLVWLAAGRPGGAAVGYANLYLCGLERRLLLDDAKSEAPAILVELRRLSGLYGDDHVFGLVVRKLIDIAALMAEEDAPPPAPSLLLRNGYELPLGLLIQLGKRVGEGQPLDADLALCWLLAMPNTWPRTPVTRCFDEFVALWRVRFDVAYPKGLKVRTPKARIAYRYQSSAGFHADVTLPEVPDLSGTTAPVMRLHELMVECSDGLAPYSRFLGVDETNRGTLAAAMLLPVELASGPFGLPLAAARSAIEQLVRGATSPTADAVLAAVGLPTATAPLNAAQQRQMAQRLDLLGIGFEPDRRYGAGGGVRGDTPFALFEAPAGGPVDPADPAYATTRLIVEMSILAAAADGRIVPAEIDVIAAYVRDHALLADTARVRLLAALQVIPQDQPKLSSALKRLGGLPAAARREVAMAAIAAVLADGQVLPAEVRFLEKLFDTLEVPRDELYGLLHRGSDVDEPISILPARPEPGIALPREAAPAALVIDTTRLDRIRSETQDVSSLLASIFVEEAPAIKAPEAPIDTSRFVGLDAGHAALLEALIAAPMPRDVFEAAARGARLMPDGAIETINDWGFDRFDEPIIEAGDMLVIPHHLLAQLQHTDRP